MKNEDMIRAREDDFWLEAFMAALVGSASDHRAAEQVALEARLIADAALVQYREYRNDRDMEDENVSLA